MGPFFGLRHKELPMQSKGYEDVLMATHSSTEKKKPVSASIASSDKAGSRKGWSGDIPKKRSPIRSYVFILLLCFLAVKLVFTGMFVCTKSSLFPLSFWESNAALAKDGQENEKRKKGSEVRSNKKAQAQGDAPDLFELQMEIASLETSLKEISADVEKYFKIQARKMGISPETLERKRVQLKKERQSLDEERKRLRALEREIDEKFSTLAKLQSSIQGRLDEKKVSNDSRVKHLIKIYTTMPPKKAAVLIEKLGMDIIIALFSKMKGDNVGQILPYVSPEKAARISERLAKLDI